MINVFSAVFGGYERIKTAPHGPGICPVMFTDDPVQAEDRYWITCVRKRDAVYPTAFWDAKLTPHLAVSTGAVDDIVWIDGTFEHTGRDLKELVALVPAGGVGLYRHRELRGNTRDCYYDEAVFSQWYGAEHPRAARALAQAAHYEREGCPRHGGLWNSGIIVWRGAQRTVGEAWRKEVAMWSASDQVALPYVLWKLGVKPTELGDNVYDCPWFRYKHHGQ